MKKITIDNYEAWFLDYIEGNLDAASKLELEAFLLLHPPLKEKLQQADYFQLTPDILHFEHKEALKRFQHEIQPITAFTFNDFCIAAHEGLLSEKKKEELYRFMQSDAALFNEYIYYGKARLTPEHLTYPHKDKLYHEVPLVKLRTVLMWASVAAGLALIIGIYTGLFSEEAELKLPVVSHVTSSKVINETQREPTVEKISIEPIVKQSHSKVVKDEDVETKVNKTDVVFEALTDDELEAPKHETNAPTSIAYDGTAKPDSLLVALANTEEQANIVSEEGEKRKLLALMEDGIEKLNKVTKSDNLALAHETTSTGEIKSFSIKLGFIGFERKKARK